MRRLVGILLIGAALALLGYLSAALEESSRKRMMKALKLRQQKSVEETYQTAFVACLKIEALVRKSAHDYDQLTDMLNYVASSKVSLLMYKQTGNHTHMLAAKDAVQQMLNKHTQPSH